jgi:aspartyl-tRNA(Asn)/glutamyl-tRNA(Gln) amidotransferase subunit A
MNDATAREIRDAVAAGRLSATEVCRAALDRLAGAEPAINAFITVCADRALARAAAIDADAELRRLPLAGVPVAVKDNILTGGTATTAGSRVLAGFIPPYSATVVERLEGAGAVVVGKTNCDEFAMGSSTENSAFGPTRNPWAFDRTPGGSSGGSAAAVAAGVVPAALGSDTGGSVRQPAALCGIVGLKPSYGRLSRYGLIAFASSLDQVGPLARTVGDAASLLQAIAGPDPADATAAAEAVPDWAAALTGDIRGLRVGVPDALLQEEGIEAGVVARVTEAVAALRALGARVVDVALPHARYGIPVYYLIATAEASSNLARYDGVRYGFRASPRPIAGASDAAGAGGAEAGEPGHQAMYADTRERGFGAEVKRRIMLGTYVLSAGYYDAYYLKAQRVRTLIARDYEAALGAADVIATPTSPTTAFRLGERVEDPLRMYLADVLTVGPSLAGLPAISVPCGLAGDGLPVGLQLVGRRFDEATVLRIADAYERVRGRPYPLPPIATDR